MARRTAVRIAWVVAAIVLALGAAGIDAALDHMPGGAGRPELTWTADRDVGARLDAATADLQALADAVGVLGENGRAALGTLVGRDTAGLTAAIGAGTAQLDVVDAAAARLKGDLAGLPLAGADRAIRHSAATLARFDELSGALASVEPLRPAWERLAAGVVPAVQLTSHLLDHDTIAGEAVRLGGKGKYAQAIARIDKATAELDAARVIRDRLAATVDVTTLDEWVGRNAAYDTALRDLWDALRTSKGRVTDAVRKAAARERVAKDQLPPDARALVVILGDVARGGLNQAVITIEEARGELLEAHAKAVTPPAQPGATASPSAAPTAPTP